MSDRKRIYLCLAHMSEAGIEQKYIKEAFDTNWVVPLGPNVNGFEKDLEEFIASPQPSPEGKGANKDFGVHTADPMLYGVLKENAERMRKNPTDAESVLWGALKANAEGLHFRRQHIIQDFIVDYYCNEKKLTIELDGGYHDNEEQKKLDKYRTAELKRLGYTELRFRNEEVISNINGVLASIKDVASQLPSLQGGDGGRHRVVALSSGTSAVHLALIACGVGPGDEVIVQSFTFCASSHPITYLGATPVFVDSERETWNMDPELLEIAIRDRIAKTGKKPKAIVPVALYGMPYQIDKIMEIANRYEIPVIEDAAEGFGSRFNGQVLGTFGKYGVLSFNGNKMITTSGGGALICNEPTPNPSLKGRGIHTADKAWYGLLKECAEENRNKPTEAESVLWEALRGKGIDEKFRRQHIIDDFIVDFFCADKGLIIEVDGGYHNYPPQMKADKERTEVLSKLGYIEIRFNNEEILYDIDSVLQKITNFCNALTSKSHPSGGDLEGADEMWREIMMYATQYRESYPYYQHEKIGYNYRMSNICAGIGRGQMTVVNDHIAHHKHVQKLYEELLADIKGVTVHTQPECKMADGRGQMYNSNYWLCTITLDPDLKIKGQENAYKEVVKGAVGGAAGVIHVADSATTDCQPNDNVEALRVFMDAAGIEARPVWKPMHKQPVYTRGKKEEVRCENFSVVTSGSSVAYINGVSEAVFKVGMCLPAGPYVSDDDVRYIVQCIKDAIDD